MNSRILIFALIVLFALPALAFSPKPHMSRQYSLGTKGYACYSTISKSGARCKTATAAGVATVSKFYLDGDESKVMPSSDETIDVQRRNASKICQRAYSSATALTSHCWGE